MIKWHDLVKNPMDLPKDEDGHGIASKKVLACFDLGGTLFGYNCAYYSYEKKCWLRLAGDTEIVYDVLRWAYIEYTEDAKPSPKADLTKLRDALIKGVENVDNQIHEFAADVKRNGDSFSEALTCALIGYMASEVKYGILKEFAEHGKTD